VSPLIITGTGTGVGKTITTAAVAALARARGERVAVVKPAQTGEPPGEPPAAPGDLAVVHALTGLDDLHELARYPDPLSPEAAARTAGQRPLDLRRAADYVAALAEDRDLVLVEGAGGLLVRYDPAGTTIADLAAMLDAPVLVVTAAGLGTLNHTALTLEALATRKLACAGVVIGSWPAEPGPTELCNLTDLAALAGQPVAGILPAGAGELEPGAFTEVAVHGLGPALGGSLDVSAYRAQAARNRPLMRSANDWDL
jgi:dethiobiotin synthetase